MAPLSPAAPTSSSPSAEQADAGSSFQWYSFALPLTSTLGVLGNLVSLVVLMHKRGVVGGSSSSQAAKRGLAALALSDLLFCLAVLPYSFVTDMARLVPASHVFRLYYRVYGTSCIHLFLMISTYLVLVTALMRFVAVAQPLHARRHPLLRFSRSVIVGVFVLSAAFTLPYFLMLKVRPYTPRDAPSSVDAADNNVTTVASTMTDSNSSAMDARQLYEIVAFFDKPVTRNLKLYNLWVWPIIATFIPLLALVATNGALIRLLRQASVVRRKTCNAQSGKKDSSSRLTVMLITIIIAHLVLVVPAEVLKFINPYASWGEVGHTIAAVANFLQAVNFSINFFLYLATNALFRQALSAALLRLGGCRRLDDDRFNNTSRIDFARASSFRSSVRVTTASGVVSRYDRILLEADGDDEESRGQVKTNVTQV